MQLYTETPYMTRVRGGPLIEDIFSQMVQKIKGELSRNCSIYSAHDTTLNFVMTALGVINETAQLPDYGATLCFEMRCKQIIDFDNCDLQVSGRELSIDTVRLIIGSRFIHIENRSSTISTPPRSHRPY